MFSYKSFAGHFTLFHFRVHLLPRSAVLCALYREYSKIGTQTRYPVRAEEKKSFNLLLLLFSRVFTLHTALSVSFVVAVSSGFAFSVLRARAAVPEKKLLHTTVSSFRCIRQLLDPESPGDAGADDAREYHTTLEMVQKRQKNL